MVKSKGGFYAVSIGHNPGVYTTWDECEQQVKGFPGAKYKKFTNAAEAEAFAGATDDVSSILPDPRPNPPSNSVEHKGKNRASSPIVDDESGWDVVYSDGACKGNGKAGSVAGIGVWWGTHDDRNIAERCPGDQTNNRAELIAILRVLETTPANTRPLLIKTDSQYSINCFKSWLPKWLKNNFRTASGEPVKNASLIRYISAHLDARALRGQKVRLQYVQGHVGIEGNEGADAEANRGTTLPPVDERDWSSLEKDLRKRIETETRNRTYPSEIAPIEVEDSGDFVPRMPVATPPKGRRLGPSSSRFNIASAKSSPTRLQTPPPQTFAVPSVAPSVGTIDADDLALYAEGIVDDDELLNDLID